MSFLRLSLACLLLAVVGHAPRGWGQAEGAVRLAVVVESPSAAQLGDVLTAELTGQPNVQLVERSEIEKVYREQWFSAANRNDLTLGQVLGADGLVFLNLVKADTNTELAVRVTAVKPGVILTQARFAWPSNEPLQWVAGFVPRIAPLFPKLKVSAKEAIGISVVNFRSAVQSTNAQSIDREFKSLVIQRLSREARFFVTERDRMRLLGEEKDRNGDESPFWNAGYLLDGVIDPNGYSPNTIQVHVRLTPRGGAAPVEFDAEGSRSNWVEVVNRIGARATEALRVESTARALEPAQEASEFFAEAKWALSWSDFAQAQNAGEAAWALGKKDMECAKLRLLAYAKNYYGRQVSGGGSTIFTNRRDHFYANRELIVNNVKRACQTQPDAMFSISGEGIKVVQFQDPPPVDDLEDALWILEIYRQFSESVPGELKVGTEWYRIGVECLRAASRVLQGFALRPGAQAGLKDKLAELRAAARSTAMLIFSSPPIHDRYVLPSPKLLGSWANDFVDPSPSIYLSLVQWGCFWQDRPEATLSLYRELMRSPNFWLIHQELWCRDWKTPRLVGWNNEDRERIPALWQSFVQELHSSTNITLKLEGMAFDLADVDGGYNLISAKAMLSQLERKDFDLPPVLTDERFEACYTNFSETLSRSKGALASISEGGRWEGRLNDNVPPGLGWDTSRLVSRLGRRTRDSMATRLWKRSNNIVAISWTTATNRPIVPSPAPSGAPVAAPEDILTVRQFLEIPMDGIDGKRASGITAHHWQEGKLLINIQGRNAIAILDPQSMQWTAVECPAVPADRQNRSYNRSALFEGNLFDSDNGEIRRYDFKNRSWVTLSMSNGENYALFVVGGHLYAASETAIFEIVDGGKATRLMASTRRNPPVSELDRLGRLGSPLLLAGANQTVEACVGTNLYSWNGREWSGLALLPHGEWYGRRTLPERVESSPEGLVFFTASLTIGSNERALHRLLSGTAASELCLVDEGPDRVGYGGRGFSFVRNAQFAGNLRGQTNPPASPSKPLWKLPKGRHLNEFATALHGGDLYLMASQAGIKKKADEHSLIKMEVLATNGYHDELLCFSPGLDEPVPLYLKFESSIGCPPVNSDYWMLFTDKHVFFGIEYPSSIGLLNVGYSKGVWALPVSEIESAIAERKLKVKAAAQERKRTLEQQNTSGSPEL